MKIAKATKDDIEAAFKLTGLLNTISDGYCPKSDDDPDCAFVWFDPDDKQHLRILYDELKTIIDAAPGGWNRVIWGFGAIMDSGLIDENAGTLEPHPRILRALEKDGADGPADRVNPKPDQQP